jgi:hypothetical protein
LVGKTLTVEGGGLYVEAPYGAQLESILTSGGGGDNDRAFMFGYALTGTKDFSVRMLNLNTRNKRVEIGNITRDTPNGGGIGLTFDGSLNSTVANLPVTPPYFTTMSVKDASSPTIGSAVVGGGASRALVTYDGTNWVCLTGATGSAGLSEAQIAGRISMRIL